MLYELKIHKKFYYQNLNNFGRDRLIKKMIMLNEKQDGNNAPEPRCIFFA